MTTTALRALILDFDGVIMESNALKTAAFEAVFARFPDHAAAMMAYHRAHVSRSRFDKFEHLVYARLGRDGDRAMVDALAGEFSAHLAGAMAACLLVPGARELLDEFSPRVPLVLASVTPEPELHGLLERRGLAPYFHRVFGCPPWTKANAVAVTVREFGGPDGLVLVGDSAGDQQAARASDVTFIGRDSGLPLEPPVRAFADLHGVAAALRPLLPS